MATKNGGTIRFGIQFDVNKSSLNQITKQLQAIQTAATSNKDSGLAKQFDQAASAARKLEQIVNSSWNHKLDQLNLNKFNQSVKTSFGSVQNLKNQLVASGASGQAAFNTLAHSVLNTNVQLRQSNTLLDSMAVSMKNTIKWGITASIFNKITGSIQQAFYYAKDLNTSLTDIRMVTGASADEMQRFAKTANDVSKSLGRSTLDYTRNAVEYYRQGLTDEQVAKRTEVTLKAQNITGAGKQMVDYLTAVWNGFKINTEGAEQAVDSLAKVADSSASNMSQLATAMSKVAATANVVGVDFNQLNAMIATVVATTRLAPESVGTAFKTVFARINDIKTGAEDAEISLGNYSGRMQSLGISVLDTAGRLRNTGDVITEVGQKWKTLTKEQQTYLAATMGGQRQITQVMALFDNWEQYVKLLNTSLQANGTLNQKNDIYLESMAAHMQQLSTEAERMYKALIDTDAINPLIDALKGALGLFNNFIEGIGGGTNAFINLGAIAANIFNKQIGAGINNVIQNIERLKSNLAQVQAQKEWSKQALTMASINHSTNKDNISQNALEKQAQITQRTLQIRKALTQEQYNQVQQAQRQIGLQQTQVDYIESYKQNLKEAGINQESTLGVVERQRDNLESVIALTKDVKIDLQEIALSSNDTNTLFNLWIENLDEINNRLREAGVSEENIDQINEQVLDAIANQEFSLTKINEILNNHGVNIKENEKAYNNLVEAARKMSMIQDGTLDKTKQQISLRQQLVKKIQDSAQRLKTIQGLVRGLTGGVQAASALIGGISTGIDKSATASQRLNGIWQGLSGTVGGIANIFLPGSGILVQGIFSLIQGGLNLLGVWDDIEFAIMSSQEKIAKVRQDLSDISNETNPHKRNIASLEDNVEEFEELYNKRNRLTDEQTERYHELINEFTQYNDAVIAGYDAQGNVIIDHQEALRETIQLQRDAARQAAQRVFAESGGGKDYAARLDNTATAQASGFAQAEQNMLNLSATAPTKARQLKTLLDVQGESPFNLQAFLNDTAWESYYAKLEETNAFQTDYFKQLGFQNVESLKNAITDVVNEYQNIETDEQAEEIKNKLIAIWKAFAGAARLQEDEVTQNIIKQALVTLNTALLEGADQATEANAALDIAADELDRVSEGLELYYDNIFNLLKYGPDGASDAYQELQKSKYYDSSLIDNALMEYLKTFKAKAEGWGQDVLDQANRLSDNQGLQRAGEAFIKAMLSTLTVVSPNIDQAKKQLAQFDGNLNQYNEEVINVINQIIKDSYTDQELQKLTQTQVAALQELLQKIFNIDNLQINLDNIKDGQFVEQIKTEEQVLKEDLQNALIETFGDLTISPQNLGFSINLQGLDFNLDSLENADLELLKQHFSELDFSELIYRMAKEAEDPAEAFHAVFQKLKSDVQGLGEVTSDIGFSDLYDDGWEKLLKAVQSGDALSESQENILNILQQQDSVLKDQIRGSDEYNKRLKTQKTEAQQIYQKELERNKQILLRRKTVLQFMSLFGQEEKYASEILQIEQQLANIQYEEIRIERDQNSQLQQRKKIEEQILKLKQEQTDKDISAVKNTKDTVKHLKDSDEDITTQDYATMLFWENRNSDLAALAGADGAGRFSQAYLDKLKQLSKGQDAILSDLYSDAVEQAQQAVLLAQENLNQINKEIVSTTEYNQAKSRQGAGQQLEGDLELIASYENQSELISKQTDATQKLEQAQLELAEAQGLAAEAAREQNIPLSQLITTFESLSDKISSAGFMHPLEGDDLTQWETTLDKILQRYRELGQLTPELQSAISLLHLTELSGTKEYQAALREVQHTFHELRQEELLAQSEKAGENLANSIVQIDIESDFDKFKDEVEEFLNIERELIINVHSDAEDIFENLQNQMERIYDASSKIGQNFVVAADDIRQLNEVFPGIIEGMEDLGDGTARLNQEVVQQALAGIKQVVQADAQSVNAQLESQAALLDAKAEMYGQAAEAAGRLAQAQTTGAQMSAQDQDAVYEALMHAKADKAADSATSQVDSAYEAAQQTAEAAQQSASEQARISDQLGTVVSQNIASAAQSSLTSMSDAAQNITTNFSQEANASNQLGAVMAANMASSAQSQAAAISALAQSAIQSFNAIAAANRGAANGQVVRGSVGGAPYVYSYGGAGGGGVSQGVSRRSISSTYSGSQGNIGATNISQNAKAITSTYGANSAAIAGANSQLSMLGLTGQIGADGKYYSSHQEAVKSAIEGSGKTYAEIAEMFTQLKTAAQAGANSIRGMIQENSLDLSGLEKELGSAAGGRPKSSKGGGGGGGGGGKQPDVMQPSEQIVDRYHDIDMQLKMIAVDLDKLQEEQERAFGKDLVKNLNKQLDALEHQNAAYQTRLEITQKEAAEMRALLAMQGTTFDEDGLISNFANVMSSKLAGVNATIDYYNSLSAQEQEAYKETVEAAKEDYEHFKEQIEHYDELISETIPEFEKNIRDNLNKRIEIQVSKFKMSVEIELDLAKAEKDWNKFRKKVINQIRQDDILGNTKALFEDLATYYSDGGLNVIGALTNQLNGTLDQLHQIDTFGTSSVYGDNKSKAVEDLKTFLDELISNLEDVEDLIDEIENSIFDAIDKAQDAFDDQVDTFEHISDVLDHNVKLVKMLYGEQAYDALGKYYQLQEANNNQQLDFLRQQKQLWYDRMMLEYQRMNELEPDSDERKKVEKRFKQYKQHWMKSTKELNSLLESSVQNIIDKYANAINNIFNNLNKRLTGGRGLEYISEEWQLINKEADMYLDRVNSMYEIEKLQNAFRDAINDNEGNIKAQQSLNDLMQEELKYLRDKDKLTQYDVDRANALLQIEIKRLALQNAQQNKTKLRLRRDSQGNYSYQYTSDQGAIAKSQDQLAQAQNNLYNLTKNAYKSNLQSFYDIYEEWVNKVKEVQNRNDLDSEQKAARRAELTEHYGNIINGILSQNEQLRQFLTQDTFNELLRMYLNDIENFRFKSEEEKAIFQRLVESIKNDSSIMSSALVTDMGNATTAMATNMNNATIAMALSSLEMRDKVKEYLDSLTEYQKNTVMSNMVLYWNSGIQSMMDTIIGEGGFSIVVKSCFTELERAALQFEKSLRDLAAKAGVSLGDIDSLLKTDVGETKALIKENETLIKKYGDEISTIGDLIEKVKGLTEKYGDAKQAAIDAATEAKKYWEAEQKAAQDAAEQVRKATQAKSKYNESGYNGTVGATVQAPSSSPSNGGGGGSASSGGGSAAVAGAASIGYTYYIRGWNASGVYKRQGPLTKGATDAFPTVGWKPNIEVTRSDGQRRYFGPGQVYGFKTGGYTGDWSGTDGRLAMLHQKELILNAEDTQNILKAVDVTRMIDDMLSSIGTNVNMANILSNTNTSDGGLLDQNVHITATFPNVTNHAQVEQALETLVNRASQYAFRNR